MRRRSGADRARRPTAAVALRVIVYLVCHAQAEPRAGWQGDDRLRPLDERGRRQADALVEQLGRRAFKRIVSNPDVRCVETVVPLAHARGLAVEHADALIEGAGAGAALALFRGAAQPLVACVHGDFVEDLLGEDVEQGSTTVLDVRRSSVEVRERLEPEA